MNRGRKESRAIETQQTDPEQVCFPAARQIGALQRRVQRNGKATEETVHLISSLSVEELSAAGLQQIKRDYWSIESDLHYRLDEVMDEDRSRVRTPRAAQVLGMFRRLAISFAIPWIEQKKKKRKRISTRDFHDHLRVNNARAAFILVTAKAPTTWLP